MALRIQESCEVTNQRKPLILVSPESEVPVEGSDWSISFAVEIALLELGPELCYVFDIFAKLRIIISRKLPEILGEEVLAPFLTICFMTLSL